MKRAVRPALAVVLSLVLAALAGACSDGSPGGQPPDAGVEAAVPVLFADANFEQCVRAALARPDGDLFPADLATLLHLECQDAAIASLGGLEHATALTDLSLWENQIADLGPLSGLTQLVDLQLGLNQIQDLTPLAQLVALRRLGLAVNRITSLQPLAGLTELEWLNLDHNALTNAELTHLAGLGKLRWLTLEHNGLTELSALDALVTAGCDLYGQAARARTPDAATRFAGRAAPVPRGSVELTADAAGAVALHYRADGRRLPVRQVFAGALVTRGDRVFYEARGRRTEVGRLTPGGQQLCAGEFARVCRVTVGRKGPGAGTAVPGAGTDPVITVRLDLLDPTPPRALHSEWGTAFHDLEPFALASPNQFDAGSCLFMANSGALEILMNQHTPAEQIQYGGDTDLSERFLMVAPEHISSFEIPYELTDSLYAYNVLGGSLLSRDYPFCAGYVKDTASGSVVLAAATDPDAYLSCSYNWFDKLPGNWQDLLVPTPPVERTSIFVDPLRDEDSQWRVGLFDNDTIAQIKHELRTKKAPVLVVYNHFLYWHTNVIVGFEDSESTGGGCPFVQDSIAYFRQKGFAAYATRIESRMAELGGCQDTGVFYVRDSIYDGGDDEPMYDYSTAEVSVAPERYSDRIVKLEYDWAKYLGNHAYSVHRK
jgi:hypothetical protein